MSETSVKDVEIFKVAEQRRGLFSLLSHVLVTSRDKFDKEKASNADRQKWARIIVSGCQAYAEILKTVELEQIEKRLEKLESGNLESWNRQQNR